MDCIISKGDVPFTLFPALYNLPDFYLPIQIGDNTISKTKKKK